MTNVRLWSWVRSGLGVLVAVLAIQLVPYGHGLTNPPVTREPAWDSAETRTLARQACFDCHSNETRWPAYARVAPASWLLARDVAEARAALNFSEWQRPQGQSDKAAEAIGTHAMPLPGYRLMHAPGRLTDDERTRLALGLARTLGRMHRDERARR